MATLQEVGFSADDVRDALLTVGLWGSVDVAAEALLEQDSDDDAVKTARKERVAAGIEADKADPRELCQRVCRGPLATPCRGSYVGVCASMLLSRACACCAWLAFRSPGGMRSILQT